MMSPLPLRAASISLCLLALAGAVGCVSLRYDEPVSKQEDWSAPKQAASSATDGAPAQDLASSPDAASSPESIPSPAGAPAAEATPTDSTPSAAKATDATPTDATQTTSTDVEPTPAAATATPARPSAPRTRTKTPTYARLDARQSAEASSSNRPRSWRELARLARESAQAGKLDRASELLAEAAAQLKDRRPTNVQRRTVFGLRARLANDLVSAGQLDEADALADQLFAEVRLEPTLGGTALVDLARATAKRRAQAAREAGKAASQLPLMTLAFDAAQTGTASRGRLNLAFEVSTLALREGDLDLARAAIDQAILDAQIVAPGDRMQTGALKIYKTRIALAQKDLDTAEAAAHTAVQLFAAQAADASSRGVAEATLAQVFAEKGEKAESLELGRTAYARLSGPDTLVAHARRQIAYRFARIEWLAGERDSAGAHYREALSIPPDGSDLDADLIREVKNALAQLETSSAASTTP